MSVYSPAAAYQRKIEIIAVDIEYEDELFEEIKHEITTQKKMVDEVEGTSLYKPGEEPAETHAEPKSGGGNSSAIIFIDEEDEDFDSQPATQPSNVQTKPQTAVQPKPAAKPQSAPAPKPTKPAAKPSPVIEMAPMDFEEDEDDYPRTRTQVAPIEEPAPVYYQEQEMKKYDGEEIFKAK